MMRRTSAPSSISGRLIRMNLLVSGAVLLLAAMAFFSYDILSFRESLIHSLEAEAQIVGGNSVSAVTFDDPVSAETTLEALRRSPDINSAILVTSDGAVFATYHRSHDTTKLTPRPLPAHAIEYYWTSGQHLVLAQRIVFQGKTIGTVYIAATLTEIGQRARHYVLIALVILLFCMAAALLISAAARRLIAGPIIALANTARSVSREKDYSVRAAPESGSVELGVLTKAFNDMLEQIEQRDAALMSARDELEVRVEERTAELQAANRELEAFSYTVAHDLRGPLDAITGIAYILLQAQKGTLDAESMEMLGRLQSSTHNMAALIDDLLNFSRASTAPVKREEVNLSAIAREIAADLRSSAPERDVDFDISDLPPVTADPGLMRIVLDNLLRNAWKYTSRHGKACIEFGAKLRDGRMMYFVKDDGAGFDPKLTGQIFQPFHRLHSKRDFPGTGVGLATVQRILTRHGGDIWAEAQVEKGATFYFTLAA